MITILLLRGKTTFEIGKHSFSCVLRLPHAVLAQISYSLGIKLAYVLVNKKTWPDLGPHSIADGRGAANFRKLPASDG